MTDKTEAKTPVKSQAPEIRIADHNEEFSISVLCKFINPYKGDRETLTAFLTNCQNALDLASPNQKTLLFKYIYARLEGKAQIACSNKIFENFESLKTFLKQNFGERKHYNHLLIDIQSCKQEQNETVAQFALRIETCLTDLQSEIHNSDSYKKDLPGRIAMTEDLALHTFSLGLHPKLGNMVRCRNPKSLNSAINIALEEEKIQNLLYKTSYKPKCRTCGKIGHSEQDCLSKPRHVAQPRAQVPHSSHTNPVSQIFCRYCKKNGHDISQCRKRQYNNEKYKRDNSHVRTTADAHHVTEEARASAASPDPIYSDNAFDYESNLN